MRALKRSLPLRRPPSPSLPPQSTFTYPPTAALTDPEQGLKTAIEAYKRGNGDAALVIARRVSEQFPNTLWYQRSLFLTEKALIKLDRASEADAAMLRVQEDYPDLSDYALFLLAEYHFSSADYSQAAALYQQVTERYPAQPACGALHLPERRSPARVLQLCCGGGSIREVPPRLPAGRVRSRRDSGPRAGAYSRGNTGSGRANVPRRLDQISRACD